MKISEQWLREWVAVKLDARALADRLTLAGLEVGSVVPVAAPLENVVVGEILSIAPHPQAERLRVCQVNVGTKRPLTIVCGAANAAAGLRVPTALEGATLPNGNRIVRTAIRGVDSAGMLCSAADLGLEESSAGLLVLDAAARPGMSLTRALQLDDRILEIDLTPNRGDCLSVMGLARELVALTAARYTPVAIRAAAVKSRRKLAVTLGAKTACARYAGRVIEGIDPTAVTPMWLQERLRRAGVRSIHPLVDVANYVMLELGQPLHAFDLDRLAGRITVRMARDDETLTLLDGSKVTLATADLVIADTNGPLALAGIMGGQASAVSTATVNLFLESAWFRPEVIGMRARRYGLHSESSHRFERGVDPAMQKQALERATALILSICGGRAGPVTEAVSAAQLPKSPAIHLRSARIQRLLGMPIPAATVEAALKRLGMRVVRTQRGKGESAWRVKPPSWRFDQAREVDLIEELARLIGYEKLPVHAPRVAMHAAPLPEACLTQSRLRKLLMDRDYQEAITYSFVDPALQALIRPDVNGIPLTNPISADMAVMRTSLWPGLIQATAHNLNRQQDRVRLFEIGRRYLLASNGMPKEQSMVAGIACGTAYPEQWGTANRPVDFFDVKGDIEALMTLGDREQFRFQPGKHPALHPGQCAEVIQMDTREVVGVFGALHPELMTKIGLEKSAFVFELSLEAFQAASVPKFREISRFPAIRRDLAVIVPGSVLAQDILDCVRETAGSLLANLELFDEYRGEGIDSGRKSLALGLTFQDTSRTLIDKDVETAVGRVLDALRSGFDGQLRQ
jgi:phenylalanyl-tRNA synthetase beta chain